MAFRALEALAIAAETWGPQCSFESKIIPRTFIDVFVVTISPLTEIAIGRISPLEKRQISVFFLLTFRPECESQFVITTSESCSQKR